MPPCKAPHTTYPLAKSQRTSRKASTLPESVSRVRARVGNMVNVYECLINVVMFNKLKTRVIGLSQNGNAVGTGTVCFPVMGEQTLPAEKTDLTCQCHIIGTW